MGKVTALLAIRAVAVRLPVDADFRLVLWMHTARVQPAYYVNLTTHITRPYFSSSMGAGLGSESIEARSFCISWANLPSLNTAQHAQPTFHSKSDVSPIRRTSSSASRILVGMRCALALFSTVRPYVCHVRSSDAASIVEMPTD